METDRLGLHESFVDDHLHLVVRIVNLGEQRQMSLFDPERAFQELVIGESERSALVMEFLRFTSDLCSDAGQFLDVHRRIEGGHHHPQSRVGLSVGLFGLE